MLWSLFYFRKELVGVEQRALYQWEYFEVHEGKPCLHAVTVYLPDLPCTRPHSQATIVPVLKIFTYSSYVFEVTLQFSCVHEFLALSPPCNTCPTGSSWCVWKDWSPDKRPLLHTRWRPWYPRDFQTTHHHDNCLLCTLRWTGLLVLWRERQFCLNHSSSSIPQ